MAGDYDLVVVANRLPVDRVEEPDGSHVVAPQPRRPGDRAGTRDAARGRRLGGVGGHARRPPGALRRRGRALRAGRAVGPGGGGLLRGVLQRHAVAALPRRHRRARLPPQLVGGLRAASTSASRRPRPSRPSEGATVWVQDYQLQLVPRMLRAAPPGPARSGSSTTSPSRRSRSSRSCRGARRSSTACSGRTSSASSAPRTPTTSPGPAGAPRTCRRARAGSASTGRAAARCGRRRSPSPSTSTPWTGSPSARTSRRGRRRSAATWATPSTCCSGWTAWTTPRGSCTG